MSDVPDDVFAAELVGPGLAIDPMAGAAETATNTPVIVRAPISGHVFKLFPHAFAVSRDATGLHSSVLVHLGIDTVKLHGEGFELHATETEEVAAGDPIAEWDLSIALAAGLSPVVPVIAIDTKPHLLHHMVTPGTNVVAGDLLFTIGADTTA